VLDKPPTGEALVKRIFEIGQYMDGLYVEVIHSDCLAWMRVTWDAENQDLVFQENWIGLRKVLTRKERDRFLSLVNTLV
jgi:hypothetical protein